MYGALGTFWPTPKGNVALVARVTSGFVGGYGGITGGPAGGWFGSLV